MKRLLTIFVVLIVSANCAMADKYTYGLGAGLSFLNMDDIGKTAFDEWVNGRKPIVHTDNSPLNFNFSGEVLREFPSGTMLGLVGGFTFARHTIAVTQANITTKYNVKGYCINLGLRAQFKTVQIWKDYSMNFGASAGLLGFNTFIEKNSLGGTSYFFMPELRFAYRFDSSHDAGLSISYVLDAGFKYTNSSRDSQWGGLRVGAIIAFL